MTLSEPAGYTRNGLPYNRFGSGSNPLLIFQGLAFENKPTSERMARFLSGYGFLDAHYTIYVVGRKMGLPQGYSLTDMANDYAEMISGEFGYPVDVIGISTGGSIAQHFAADHPQWVRRLILHSAAHTLGAAGKAVQLQMASLARQQRWREVNVALFSFMLPRAGIQGLISRLALQPLSFCLPALLNMRPDDPSDLIITIAAEDQHRFRDRLPHIVAPTLLIAGEIDPFYAADLFYETAVGIPHAQLILYPDKGHLIAGTQFEQDIFTFLYNGTEGSTPSIH